MNWTPWKRRRSKKSDLTAANDQNDLFADVWQLLACPPLDRARIIPHLDVREYAAGETIFQAGEPADHLFILREGLVHLPGLIGSPQITSGCFGEEAGLGYATYSSHAVAAGPTLLVKIPRRELAALLARQPDVKASLYASFIGRVTGHLSPRLDQPAAGRAAKASPLNALGWILAILLPALVFIMRSRLDLGFNSLLFFTIFTAAVVMWVFNLMDEFIPAIFAIATLLVLDVAPPSVVLSGFGSEEFFMILSVSALGALIDTSGLAYRTILLLLRRMPSSQFWCNLIVVMSGTGLCAVLPSANGRISLGMPVYRDMVELLGYSPGGKAATSLGSAMFCGMSLFSGLFLTSKTIHFVMYGMMPQQVIQQFGFVYWTVAAAVYGAVMLLLYFLLAPLFFRNREVIRLPREQFAAQIRMLGPLSYRERVAAVSVVIMIAGFVTTSLHMIDPPWLALALLFVLLALGVLKKKEFQQKINWPFLLYLGALTGLSKVMVHTGFDRWLGSYLGFVVAAMQNNFPLFILLLFLAITAVRFFVPNNATVLIFLSFLLPLAGIAGIHPWIFGFIVVCLSDAWVFPYQCTYYSEFREINEHKPLYDELTFLGFNVLTNLFRLAAIFASLFYWKWLGLL